MRWIYTALLYLLTPILVVRLARRGSGTSDHWRRWEERFGWVRPMPGGIAVWVHAVSVGEAIAAQPLIKRLIADHAPGTVLVTTTTQTGSAWVRKTLGDSVRHTYAPHDLPGVIARFLARMQPRQVVVMETELWPNLFHALKRRGIPLIIANARLSPRSFKGYSRVPGFAASTLADCAHIAAQSEVDAERFRALGALTEHVSVMGNIKFDLEVPAEMIQRGHQLRARIGGGHKVPVWIAASTHEGEEETALQAHAKILHVLPQAMLILVPRHPERFDDVSKLVDKSGMFGIRRSALDSASRVPFSVLLGDSMGEMFMYYAAADVAFVGGSLVGIGGHNVLEPAAVGLPVLFGPYMHNFIPARDLLLSCNSAVEVGAETLAHEVLRLLQDEGKRRECGEAGKFAVQANRGALQKLLSVLASTRNA